MSTKVTIQDIADALGLSRNTVSKAINNTGILADATRERILQKAIEMGYKQFSYLKITGNPAVSNSLPPAPARDKVEIALISSRFLGSSHFSNLLLDKFQQEITPLGYSLTMHRVDSSLISTLRLPATLHPERTAGIICFELFDYDYASMLCSLDIPVLFADGPVPNAKGPLNADLLLMDNTTHIFSIVNEMKRRGKTKIGFIGEILHCRSFCERFLAMRDAMYMAGMEYREEFCFTKHAEGIADPCKEDYLNYLKDCISSLKELPDLFICANDFIARDVLQVMSEIGISVPSDLYLCGFDDAPEARLISPPLTTIHIHTQIMGFSAAHLLLTRIKEPSLYPRTVYTNTDIIYRESTQG